MGVNLNSFFFPALMGRRPNNWEINGVNSKQTAQVAGGGKKAP